jgi:hypothetical protein
VTAGAAVCAPPDGLALGLFWWIPAISVVVAYFGDVSRRKLELQELPDRGAPSELLHEVAQHGIQHAF